MATLLPMDKCRDVIPNQQTSSDPYVCTKIGGGPIVNKNHAYAALPAIASVLLQILERYPKTNPFDHYPGVEGKLEFRVTCDDAQAGQYHTFTSLILGGELFRYLPGACPEPPFHLKINHRTESLKPIPKTQKSEQSEGPFLLDCSDELLIEMMDYWEMETRLSFAQTARRSYMLFQDRCLWRDWKISNGSWRIAIQNLTRHGRHLRSLELPMTGDSEIDEKKFFLELALVCSNVITKVDLSGRGAPKSKLDDESLIALAKSCSQLTYLDVGDSDELTDRSLRAILDNCPQLSHMDVNWCTKLSDATLTSIIENCPPLTYLDVSGNGNMTDSSMSAIFEHCPELLHLDFSWCPNLATLTINNIATHCSQLRYLDVCDCSNVTNDSLTSLVTSCHQLQYLNIIYCDELGQRFFPAVAEHCRQLTSLGFCWSQLPSVSSLLQIMKRCSQLSTLHIRALRDEDCPLLTKTIRGKVQLSHLRLDQCSHLTDKALLDMASKCPNLSSIGLEGCKEITSNAIEKIEKKFRISVNDFDEEA